MTDPVTPAEKAPLGTRTKVFMTDELLKWGVRTLIGLVVMALLAIFSPYGRQALAVWQTPDQIADLAQKLDHIETVLRHLSGDDHVLRVHMGDSYVEEPVHAGEHVVIHLVAERTTLGATCILDGYSGVFTDVFGIGIPGPRANPNTPFVHLTEDARVVRVELVPPKVLQPGRVRVHLSLQYTCAGKAVFDATPDFSYRLLAAGEGK